VFCTEKEREDRALHREMLIESRNHFFEAHKKSNRAVFVVRYTTNYSKEVDHSINIKTV
jgi:hypothetical protein